MAATPGTQIYISSPSSVYRLPFSLPTSLSLFSLSLSLPVHISLPPPTSCPPFPHSALIFLSVYMTRETRSSHIRRLISSVIGWKRSPPKNYDDRPCRLLSGNTTFIGSSPEVDDDSFTVHETMKTTCSYPPDRND